MCDSLWESCEVLTPQEYDPASLHDFILFFIFLSLWTPSCCSAHPLLTYPPDCRSIYLSGNPGMCSLTRVWFQAESTPCKTSRSQRLLGGSGEGRGGVWPGFILGRVQCSGVRSGPEGPGHDGRMNGWIHWLMIVFPRRQSDRSQQQQRHCWIELTVY